MQSCRRWSTAIRLLVRLLFSRPGLAGGGPPPYVCWSGCGSLVLIRRTVLQGMVHRHRGRCLWVRLLFSRPGRLDMQSCRGWSTVIGVGVCGSSCYLLVLVGWTCSLAGSDPPPYVCWSGCCSLVLVLQGMVHRHRGRVCRSDCCSLVLVGWTCSLAGGGPPPYVCWSGCGSLVLVGRTVLQGIRSTVIVLVPS